MKNVSFTRTNHGMTLIEVLVVIAVIALVLAVILPMLQIPDRSNVTRCATNLRSISIGVALYAGENKDKLPMETYQTHSTESESKPSAFVSPVYQKLSPYIHDPGVLICISDSKRHSAGTLKDLTDQNVSYFLNLTPPTNNYSLSILAGDRNLQVNGKPVAPGVFVLTSNLDMSWTRELHPSGGNLAFLDGHVAFCRSNNLNAIIALQGVASGRLAIP